MSNVKRRVLTDTNFDARTRRIALKGDDVKAGSNMLCPCCKAEPATIVDHVQALRFGGGSDASNALGLCTRCHYDKTKAEDEIEHNAYMVKRHIAKWYRIGFTATGNRKVYRIADLSKDELDRLRRIVKAKRQGNHKLAAKHRRTARGIV